MSHDLNAFRPVYRPDAILLPYQALWFADRSEVKIIEKSRRTGITWASAAEHAMVGGTGEWDTWYIGYSEEQGEEFIRDVAKWGRNLHGVAVEYGECLLEDVDPDTGKTDAIKAFRVDWASGKRSTALSSRPRNLRGKQGLVTIDEAAFHDDLEGLIKSSIAMLIWGARIEVISTHNGVDNYFNTLLEQTRAGKFNYSLHRVTLDDALADGLYKRICQTTGKPWTPAREKAWRKNLLAKAGMDAEEEFFCIPSMSGASYFATDVIESRMVTQRPVVRLTLDSAFALKGEDERKRHMETWIAQNLAPLIAKLPRDREHCIGQDFGRVSDLSSVAVGYKSQELVREVPFMVELENVPYEQQKQVMFALIGGCPRVIKVHMDATGNGDNLAENCADRFGRGVVECVKITEPWHMEAWAALKTMIEEGKMRMPSDASILADFKAVKRVNGIPKLPNATVTKDRETGKSKRRHGDGAVALAMLAMASRAKVTTAMRTVRVNI